MSLKKNKTLTIKLFVLFLYLIIAFISILKMQQKDTYTNDSIQINRIAAEVESHWDDLSLGDYHTFTYPFTVLDTNEKCLYTYGDPETLTLQDMMRQSDTSLSIVKNNVLMGTVIIETHTAREAYVTSSGRQNLLILIGLFILGLLVMLLYDIYLNQTILKPFGQLADFSKRIACGDYDAPLHVRGNSRFQPLVQSLDIMQDELRSAKSREYEANQSKKALVASLSHDIKTPITSIQLAIELLQVKVTDEELRERLDAVLNKTIQISQLVTDLFHTTMEDLDELPVHSREIYSTQLIQLIHEADLNQSVRTLEIPDCMVRIDPVRMEQICTNIIYNSYKYAGTAIDITGTLTPEYLEITIRDYGSGIDPEELPCIFNRFYRGSNVGDQTGSGLGLYICKCLIEKMEGEIYCHNHKHGLETLLRIPLL